MSPSKRKSLQKVILTRSKRKKFEKEKKSTKENNEDPDEASVEKLIKNTPQESVNLKECIVIEEIKIPVENFGKEKENKDGDEEEGSGNLFCEYPELEKMINEPLVKKMFEYYEKELQLADETPEKKQKHKENPDDCLVIMRNSACKFQ